MKQVIATERICERGVHYNAGQVVKVTLDRAKELGSSVKIREVKSPKKNRAVKKPKKSKAAPIG